ncbi:MAG: leucine-rich repeat domain-containing protein [Muribaculaceae bacterium]|nr:leucine-rich repeat domain-containing protein [Muribaculaceae bacterium]
MKKLKISLILITFLFSLGCQGAQNAQDSEFIEKGLKYEVLADGTVKVGKIDDKHTPKGKLNIPSKVKHNGKTYKVTAIDSWGFFGCRDIKEVKIPSSITKVDIWAFTSCTGLRKIEFPSSVTTLGYCALESCENLESVKLPPHITSIEDRLFQECKKLKTIKLPSGITRIGSSAFSRCDMLKSLEIPEGVTTIDGYAFAYSKNLANVSLPNSLQSIGHYAFSCCESLKSIKLPEGLKTIHDNLFENCRALEDVTLPASLENIYGNPFVSCKSLTEIKLAEGNPNFVLKDGILYDAAMTNLIACPSCQQVGDLIVPATVKLISPYAFYDNANITSLKMTAVETIGQSAFGDSYNIESIDFGSALKYIEKQAFYSIRKVTTLKFPNTLEALGVGVFDFSSNLKDVTIPKHFADDEHKFNNFLFQYCPSDLIFKVVDEKGKLVHTVKYNELPDAKKFLFFER